MFENYLLYWFYMNSLEKGLVNSFIWLHQKLEKWKLPLLIAACHTLRHKIDGSHWNKWHMKCAVSIILCWIYFTKYFMYAVIIFLHYIFSHLKEESYWINLISVHDFKSKQHIYQKYHQVCFFQKWSETFKNYFVWGFFVNFGSFLDLIPSSIYYTVAL